MTLLQKVELAMGKPPKVEKVSKCECGRLLLSAKVCTCGGTVVQVLQVVDYSQEN